METPAELLEIDQSKIFGLVLDVSNKAIEEVAASIVSSYEGRRRLKRRQVC